MLYFMGFLIGILFILVSIHSLSVLGLLPFNEEIIEILFYIFLFVLITSLLIWMFPLLKEIPGVLNEIFSFFEELLK